VIKIWLEGSHESSSKRMQSRDNMSPNDAYEITKKRFDKNKALYKKENSEARFFFELEYHKLADFDKVNSVGANSGLQYEYTDTDVLEGYGYSYAVTSYDRGDPELGQIAVSSGSTFRKR